MLQYIWDFLKRFEHKIWTESLCSEIVWIKCFRKVLNIFHPNHEEIPYVLKPYERVSTFLELSETFSQQYFNTDIQKSILGLIHVAADTACMAWSVVECHDGSPGPALSVPPCPGVWGALSDVNANLGSAILAWPVPHPNAIRNSQTHFAA